MALRQCINIRGDARSRQRKGREKLIPTHRAQDAPTSSGLRDDVAERGRIDFPSEIHYFRQRYRVTRPLPLLSEVFSSERSRNLLPSQRAE